MTRRVIRFTAKNAHKLVLLLALLLAACGGGANSEPTPAPALVPLKPRPTTTGPAPTVVVEGAELPGRMLVVQDGNLWLWQNDAGSQITTSGDAYQPAWSPDGQQIAYVRRVQSFSDIVVRLVAGGEPLRLTQSGPDESLYSYERMYNSVWAFYPAWSPDGSTIAFVSQGGPPFGSPAGEYNLSLFSVPATGGAATQIYADQTAQVGRIVYAPGGQSIVFAREPLDETPPSLYEFTPTTGAAALFPGIPEQSYDPAFSADGKWFAYAARQNGGTDIFLVSAAGGTPIKLSTTGSARAPAFSPDGKHIAFLATISGSNSFDIWVVDLTIGDDGTLRPAEPRRITVDMRLDADSGIAWAD